MHIYKIIRKINIFLHKFLYKKENCFDHIISLGYNCEVTFRFLKYFNFEESNLFNWAYSYSIDDLINALKKIDDIGKNGFKLPDPLWECKNTHLRFHGKEDVNIYSQHKYTENIINKDIQELQSRLSYLKEKFKTLSKSDDVKLYIYKLHNKDIDSNIEKKILSLYYILEKEIKAKNFKLLIVSTEKQNINIKNNPNIITRSVRYFASDNNVTQWGEGYYK